MSCAVSRTEGSTLARHQRMLWVIAMCFRLLTSFLQGLEALNGIHCGDLICKFGLMAKWFGSRRFMLHSECGGTVPCAAAATPLVAAIRCCHKVEQKVCCQRCGISGPRRSFQELSSQINSFIAFITPSWRGVPWPQHHYFHSCCTCTIHTCRPMLQTRFEGIGILFRVVLSYQAHGWYAVPCNNTSLILATFVWWGWPISGACSTQLAV